MDNRGGARNLDIVSSSDDDADSDSGGGFVSLKMSTGLPPSMASHEALGGLIEAGKEYALLPHQANMFRDITDNEDALVVLGRGMSQHRLLLNMLRLYCDPRSLVVVLNADEVIQAVMFEELARTAKLPPTVITNDIQADTRRAIYMRGGVVFVTSRILVVDMLLHRLPIDHVSGMIVLNAHRVLPTSSEAFILRLYRHENTHGFVKALTENPMGFVGGFSLLEKVMKCLWVSKVFLWPRFEESVQVALAAHAPEVLQLKAQPSELMLLIQQTICSLMDSCLKKLQSMRPSLDMEFLTVERGLFPSFDSMLRRQLDPVWHTLGVRTKQLVKDLKELRNMAKLLDQLDCVSFFHYLETLRIGNSSLNSNSHWLMLDAADDLYIYARQRIFGIQDPKLKKIAENMKRIEMRRSSKKRGEKGSDKPLVQHGGARAIRNGKGEDSDSDDDNNLRKRAKRAGSERPAGLSKADPQQDGQGDMEIPPKWDLLLQLLDHIREQRHQREDATKSESNNSIVVSDDGDSDEEEDDDDHDDGTGNGDGNSTSVDVDGKAMASRKSKPCQASSDIATYEDTRKRILLCVHDDQTARQITQVLEMGGKGVIMKKLDHYRRWKASAALLSKDGLLGQDTLVKQMGRRAARIARRKQRAAASTASESADTIETERQATITELIDLGTEVLQDFEGEQDSQEENNGLDIVLPPDEEFINYFQVLDEHLLYVFPMQVHLGGSTSARVARMLTDVRPSDIIFFDPNLICVREVEGYCVAHPEINVTVYNISYALSFQEQQYLSSIRYEKDAFERLIYAKQTMAIPADQDGRLGIRQKQERLMQSSLNIKMNHKGTHLTSTRKGGGRATAGDITRPKVVVDMREFRSSLPSLIHEFGMDVIPVTLKVGDYILSPEICVERKSLPDLIGSLGSGRLYQQAQAMTAAYAKPMLLIEFDETKAFSLLASGERLSDDIEFKNTMSKLTLLTITFPSLRLLWTQGARATAELFFALKEHQKEPDPELAASIDSEDAHNESDIAIEPLTLLKTIPGVTDQNVRAIIARVKNMKEFVALPLAEMQEMAGVERGREMYNFVNGINQDKGDSSAKPKPQTSRMSSSSSSSSSSKKTAATAYQHKSGRSLHTHSRKGSTAAMPSSSASSTNAS